MPKTTKATREKSKKHLSGPVLGPAKDSKLGRGPQEIQIQSMTEESEVDIVRAQHLRSAALIESRYQARTSTLESEVKRLEIRMRETNLYFNDLFEEIQHLVSEEASKHFRHCLDISDTAKNISIACKFLALENETMKTEVESLREKVADIDIYWVEKMQEMQDGMKSIHNANTNLSSENSTVIYQLKEEIQILRSDLRETQRKEKDMKTNYSRLLQKLQDRESKLINMPRFEEQALRSAKLSFKQKEMALTRDEHLIKKMEEEAQESIMWKDKYYSLESVVRQLQKKIDIITKQNRSQLLAFQRSTHPNAATEKTNEKRLRSTSQRPTSAPSIGLRHQNQQESPIFTSPHMKVKEGIDAVSPAAEAAGSHNQADDSNIAEIGKLRIQNDTLKKKIAKLASRLSAARAFPLLMSTEAAGSHHHHQHQHHKAGSPVRVMNNGHNAAPNAADRPDQSFDQDSDDEEFVAYKPPQFGSRGLHDYPEFDSDDEEEEMLLILPGEREQLDQRNKTVAEGLVHDFRRRMVSARASGSKKVQQIRQFQKFNQDFS